MVILHAMRTATLQYSTSGFPCWHGHVVSNTPPSICATECLESYVLMSERWHACAPASLEHHSLGCGNAYVTHAHSHIP